MEDREMRIIRVRNIFDNRIDEEILYELFLQAGPINSIVIPVMPGGPNGRRAVAIIEYTHEVAVPYALFIFEGTELFGNRLQLSSSNSNPPVFYVPKDGIKGPPIPAPFNNFDNQGPPPNMMLNISNTSSPSEPNFEALLRMGQSMLIPPPMGFGGNTPMNLPMSPFGFDSNNHRNQQRSDFRDHGRDRNNYSDYNRGGNRDRDSSRRRHDGNHHKHKRR